MLPHSARRYCSQSAWLPTDSLDGRMFSSATKPGTPAAIGSAALAAIGCLLQVWVPAGLTHPGVRGRRTSEL